MATENKGVMVYLPKEVEEYITSFCTEYNITRKDKEGNVLPSLGTGVVTYLKSKISGESPDDILTKPSNLPSNGLSKEEVLDIVDEYFTSHSPSNGLSKDEVLDLMKSDVLSNSPIDEDIERMVRGQIEPLSDLIAELETYTRLQFASMRNELKAKEGQLDILEEAHFELLPKQPSYVDSTPDKLPKEEREYLTFKQLATRLDYPVPEGVVVKSPGKENADTLITFAATLGQSYGWDGKKQKFYSVEV
jgi:hypothetical protein